MYPSNSKSAQNSVLSRVWVTHKTSSGLGDWIYCTLYSYIHNSGLQATNYSAIANLNTLQFTVTRTRILSLQ
jgi:hypothetical protein